MREWINWLNGRKSFDVALAFPGPARGGGGRDSSGRRRPTSYEGSVGFRRSAMAAAFDAGSGFQTPRSITDTLTFVTSSMLQAAECPTDDCTVGGGGFDERHGQSGLTGRALFAQFMSGLLFPLIFDACVKSMEFVYVA